MASGVCRCGGIRDPRGLCLHCDYPVKCDLGCVACRTRDSHCTVCHTDCGTPVGATYHDRQCRARENTAA